MTSLVASIAVDQRAPSALYIMTDSRMTWKGFPGEWDGGQKTFASSTAPHIIGFCGDASLPPSVARQFLEKLELGLISDVNDTSSVHAQIVSAIDGALSVSSGKPFDLFSIYHGARDGSGMSCKFRLWETRYSRSLHKTHDTEFDMVSEHSRLVRIDGTGRNSIENLQCKWDGTTAANTSRAAMWAFCEALASGKDRNSGGPPQLVGIRRQGAARRFGMIWNGQRYISGVAVRPSKELQNIEWFNEQFERCDGLTGERLDFAQLHDKPASING